MSSLATMSLATPLLSSSLPHCTPTSPLLDAISNIFHICIPTPLALISTLLGSMSVVSWLFAQLPQLYKNYKLQSTAGLSIFFVMEWSLGDTTNLLGGILTDQAGWQLVVGGYFVFVDICILCQFSWYGYLKPRMKGRSQYLPIDGDLDELDELDDEMTDDDDDDESSIMGLSPINSRFKDEQSSPPMTETARTNRTKVSPDVKNLQSSQPDTYDKSYEKFTSAEPSEPQTKSWLSLPSSRTLLSISTSYALLSPAVAAVIPTSAISSTSPSLSTSEIPSVILAGTILSWTSTVLYLFSRLPQLYKNYQRKSTAGLSPLLFIAAFCGNFFYSASLLTNPNGWSTFPPYGGHGWAGADGSDRSSWVRRALPFWLGAAGALVMDGLVGCQFLLYGVNGESKGGERLVAVVAVVDGDAVRGDDLDPGSARRKGGRSRRSRRSRRSSMVGGQAQKPRWELVSGWMRGWIPNMGPREKVVGLHESQRLLRGTSTSTTTARTASREVDEANRRSYGAF